MSVEATPEEADGRRTDDAVWILKRRQGGKWRITGMIVPGAETKWSPTADAATKAAFEKWAKDTTLIIDFENPETQFRLP